MFGPKPKSVFQIVFQTDLSEMGSRGFSKGVKQHARVWLYAKNLSVLGSADVAPSYKHWAVVVEYLDEEGQVDRQELYEVGRNEEGNMVAFNMAFSRGLDLEWMNEPGAERRYLGERTVNQRAVLTFCNRVTRKKEKYSAFSNNCQRFVEEFVSLVDGGEMALPPGAKDTCIGRSKNCFSST